MWYDTDILDNGIVISSRVRLARNLKKYPFSIKINNNQISDMIKEIINAVTNAPDVSNEHFVYIDLSKLSEIDRKLMVEKHLISVDLSKKNQQAAVLIKNDETVSIMLNEEDHIRIQTILSGDNIEKVWKMADKTDDLIEQNIEYAFDSEYGYLTSCPTNAGTGMRASYMLHIPLIELTGQIKYITQYIGKFGMTIRGIYGENSEGQGGIYQISNQVTMGQTEEDIISNIKAVTNQVIEQEQKLRQKLVNESYTILEDQVYRAYGLVTNARVMTVNEAMKDLSYLRLGYETGILKQPLPKSNIYSIMVNIQPANLSKRVLKNLNEMQLNEARAEFIREQF